MDENVKRLKALGLERKRNGDFQSAKTAYYEAIKIDPTDTMLFYGLAKACYLSNEGEESHKNYLIAAHLSLQYTKKHIEANTTTGQAIKLQLDQAPSELIAPLTVVHPDAVLVLLDQNTPRHLAHSFYDLDLNTSNEKMNEDHRKQAAEVRERIKEEYRRKDSSITKVGRFMRVLSPIPESPDLLEHAKQYRKMLLGNQNVVLDDRLEDGGFYSEGIRLILYHLRWEKFDDPNPALLYNHYYVSTYVRQIAKAVEEKMGFEVPYYDVIDMTDADESEWFFGLTNPENVTNRVYVCYVAMELDRWDYLVALKHGPLSQEEGMKIKESRDYWDVDARIAAIAMAKLLRQSVSDDDFTVFLQELVGTSVANGGEIIKGEKRFRTFKWVILD